MKKIIYFLLVTTLLLSGCFEEYDGTINEEWITFERTEVRISESAEGPLTATILLSAPAPEEDVVIPFTLTSEDGLTQGTDFFLSASSFTLPAGRNSATVTLLDSVRNNDVANGDRSFTITIEDTDRYTAGRPGPDKLKNSISVVIGEDDFTLYGETSFEEVAAPDDNTRYNRPGTVEMNNNAGDPPVDFSATGAELGFDTSYAADDLDDGETGRENLGVVSNAAISAGADPDFETQFIRGSQGFISADLDGRIEILFDQVSIPEDVTTLVLELTFYASLNTTFETEDALEVYFVTEDGRGDPIVSYRGSDDTSTVTDLAGNPVQGTWNTRVVNIPQSQWKDGRLLVTMRNGADTEMFMLDYIGIKGIQ